jgi:hypothetical protein
MDCVIPRWNMRAQVLNVIFAGLVKLPMLQGRGTFVG